MLLYEHLLTEHSGDASSDKGTGGGKIPGIYSLAPVRVLEPVVMP
jgi:hypothetical protein